MSKLQTAKIPANNRTLQKGGIALRVMVALFILGVGGLVFALNSETNQPDFAMLTVSFLFLMGVSQAGVVFCAITRLVKAQWAKPYYRLAELSTLALPRLRSSGSCCFISVARMICSGGFQPHRTST